MFGGLKPADARVAGEQGQDVKQRLKRKAVTIAVLAILLTAIPAGVALWRLGGHGGGTRESSSAKLAYLPERHTDYVFAASSTGMAAAGVVVLLAVGLTVVLWRRARRRQAE